MDRIKEMLAKLTELSPEELTELGQLINARFDELVGTDVATAESVGEMDALIEGLTQQRAEATRRETEAAEAAAARETARERMEAIRKGEETAEDGEGAEGQAAEGDQAAEGEGAEDGAPAEPAQPEATEPASPIGDARVPVVAGATTEPAAGGAAPVTAAGGALPRGALPTGHVAAMARNQGRAAGSPERGTSTEAEPYRVTVVAAAGLPTINPGGAFENPMQLAEAMSERLRRMQTAREHAPALVASARWDYPEDRQLGDNISENTAKIDAVVGMRAPRVSKHDGTLVATGGICLPTNVDYSVPTWSTADRPLRDNLPSFQATRGGIQFVTPPDIGTVTLQGAAAGSGLATGIWTEATDANPGAATKPVWQVACGTPQQVFVDAIPTRVEFGNMQSRFAPEQVAANTEQAIAAAAREAELNLLVKMYSASNQVVASQYLGATRDLLASIDVIAPQYRYSHRYPKNIGLTAVFPEWAADLMRADIARELAHDSGGRDPLAVTDAEIEAWFTARGINVVWTLDGLAAGTYGTGGHAIPAQFWPKFTAGNKPQWPGQTADGNVVLSWLLFVTGTFQFLDGGRLDLGVVRDSVLDATNDYETFVETFEGIAFRGNEVYQVQNTLLPNGASAGSVAVAGYHE